MPSRQIGRAITLLVIVAMLAAGAGVSIIGTLRHPVERSRDAMHHDAFTYPVLATLLLVGPDVRHAGGSGYLNNEGGTRLAAPIFAGIWARLQSANDNALGFPASSIYTYFPSNAALLHDVTSGNNGSGTYGYKAKAGRDATTGFGSVNISKLNTFIQGTSDFAR